jgi:hypothetical protein
MLFTLHLYNNGTIASHMEWAPQCGCSTPIKFLFLIDDLTLVDAATDRQIINFDGW